MKDENSKQMRLMSYGSSVFENDYQFLLVRRSNSFIQPCTDIHDVIRFLKGRSVPTVEWESEIYFVESDTDMIKLILSAS
jgi:hypothetical protein